MDSYGFLSVVPVLIVLILAIWTKRTIFSLLIGGVIGAIILYGTGFTGPWIDALYGGLSDGLWQWMALVCGLFGGLVGLFDASGSMNSFTKVAAKFANTKRKSLVTTFILGCVIFVDDWLDVLVTANAMKGVTDKSGTSREMLAYIITAHGTNICVLIPISTWAAFFAGQYEAVGMCGEGEGLGMYVSSIPFMFFSIVSLLVCFLICLQIFPLFGPMKDAELRAEGGQVFPPDLPADELAALTAAEDEEVEVKGVLGIWNFLIPIIITAVVTIITEEILYGVILALVACFIMYIAQRLLTITSFCVAMLGGFKDMVGVIMIVYSAFVLRTFNNELGLTNYVISLVDGRVSASLFPAVVFILGAALIFAAGNFWGMVSIIFPIVAPMGMAIGANMTLVGAAMVCATTMGATLVFYGSEVSLTCASVNVPVMTYVRTAYPIIALTGVIGLICFLIAGFAF